MTGEDLLKVLQNLSPEELRREVVLPVQHSPSACQKVLIVRMGGVDSRKSYEGVDAILLGDYCNVHDSIKDKVLVNKGRDGATFGKYK